MTFTFEGYWGGLHVLTMTKTIVQEGDLLASDYRVDAHSLVKLMVKLRATGYGRSRRDGTRLIPESWGYHNVTRRRDRKVDVVYSDPYPVSKVTTKPARPGKDDRVMAAVPEEDRRETLDPLSAFHALRDWIADGPDGTKVIPIYDGPRRYDLKVTYEGIQTLQIRGRTAPVHRLRISLVPLKGFKEKWAAKWRQTAYHLHASTDGRALPLQLMGITNSYTLNLSSACPAQGDCWLSDD